MAWETRSNSKQYYYSKTWVNGRCVSRYIGASSFAVAIAELEKIDQQYKQLDRDIEKAYRLELSELDSSVEEFRTAVSQIVEAVLLATGHHKVKRTWRKKRMADKKDVAILDPLLEEGAQKVIDALNRIHKNKPQKGDLDLVAKPIKEVPKAYALYGGDIERNAIDSTLLKMVGDSPSGKLLQMGLDARLRVLRTEHGYDSASPIERLLIDQICLCWLRLYWVENTFSQNIQSSTSCNLILYYEKRLTLSQIRFTRAIEALAKVRRLARRTPEILQVNIAAQQVNQVGVANESDPPLSL